MRMEAEERCLVIRNFLIIDSAEAFEVMKGLYMRVNKFDIGF